LKRLYLWKDLWIRAMALELAFFEMAVCSFALEGFHHFFSIRIQILNLSESHS
jgi:hypothetical protein